jgi:transposase
MRIAPAITLSPDQRTALQQQARSRSLPARTVERARIVLLAAEGRQDKEVASMLKVTPKKVARWRQRFLTLGMAGLERDAPRPGRTPTISASVVRRVVSLTTRQKPPTPPTGARAVWRQRWGSARPACVGSGTVTA